MYFGKEIQLPFNLSIKTLISDFTRSLTMGRQTHRNVDMVSLCPKIIPNKCRNDPSQYIIPHNMFSELLCELLHANSSFPGFKPACHNPSPVCACFLCSLSARNIFPYWIFFHVEYSQSVQQDYIMTITSEEGKIWFQTSYFYFLSIFLAFPVLRMSKALFLRATAFLFFSKAININGHLLKLKSTYCRYGLGSSL